MADEPRPVPTTSPGFARPDDLKIQRNVAERLIARYLRDRMSHQDANELAKHICDGIASLMPEPGSAALRGWRMIPEYPRYESREQVGAAMQAVQVQDRDSLAREMWAIVYRHAQDLPDDFVA
jgi:hypothetical protein